jgi:beta-ureidopropionase
MVLYVFRIIRVGLIQTHIVRPTSDPLKEQREAIYDHVARIVEAAAYCGVNIICFQELWREFYYFKMCITSSC